MILWTWQHNRWQIHIYPLWQWSVSFIRAADTGIIFVTASHTIFLHMIRYNEILDTPIKCHLKSYNTATLCVGLSEPFSEPCPRLSLDGVLQENYTEEAAAVLIWRLQHCEFSPHDKGREGSYQAGLKGRYLEIGPRRGPQTSSVAYMVSDGLYNFKHQLYKKVKVDYICLIAGWHYGYWDRCCCKLSKGSGIFSP